MNDPTRHLSRSAGLGAKVTSLLQKRLAIAREQFQERVRAAHAAHGPDSAVGPTMPWDLWTGAADYAVDWAQRSVLFWDTLRQRGNNFVEHTRAGLPPVLHFRYEMVLDGRGFERPV